MVLRMYRFSMVRPDVQKSTIEKLNEECEQIMSVDPENVGIDQRLQILLESHEDYRYGRKESQFDGRIS